jgi:hypothetical protein
MCAISTPDDGRNDTGRSLPHRTSLDSQESAARDAEVHKQRCRGAPLRLRQPAPERTAEIAQQQPPGSAAAGDRFDPHHVAVLTIELATKR